MLLEKIEKILDWGIPLGEAELFVWKTFEDLADVLGFCERSAGSGRYQIHLNLAAIAHYGEDVALVLAHELIHLDQFLSGRLQFNHGVGRFDGVYFDEIVDFMPPFEAEAYHGQDLIKDLLIKEIPDLADQLKNLAL